MIATDQTAHLMRLGTVVISEPVLKVRQAGQPIRITGATVSGKRPSVFGQNFDPGAVILVNWKEQITKQRATDSMTTPISKKTGKKIRAGDTTS